jgi:hypothetical protein
MDVEGQIAELQRERERLLTALEDEQEPVPFDHEAT